MKREDFDKAYSLYTRLEDVKRKQVKLAAAQRDDNTRVTLVIESFDCCDNLNIELGSSEIKVIHSVLEHYYKEMVSFIEEQIEAL